MDSPRPPAAFEQGYLAARMGAPRQVPVTLTTAYPVLSREWLLGYDDAPSDDETARTWMLGQSGQRLAV